MNVLVRSWASTGIHLHACARVTAISTTPRSTAGHVLGSTDTRGLMVQPQHRPTNCEWQTATVQTRLSWRCAVQVTKSSFAAYYKMSFGHSTTQSTGKRDTPSNWSHLSRVEALRIIRAVPRCTTTECACPLHRGEIDFLGATLYERERVPNICMKCP